MFVLCNVKIMLINILRGWCDCETVGQDADMIEFVAW